MGIKVNKVRDKKTYMKLQLMIVIKDIIVIISAEQKIVMLI